MLHFKTALFILHRKTQTQNTEIIPEVSLATC